MADLSDVRTVEGRVEDIGMRVENGRTQTESIWSFRLGQYDNSGVRVLFVPVEMRAPSIEGSLHNGDLVRAHGKVRNGTFCAMRVENYTTGAVVKAKELPKIAKVLAAVIAVIVFAIIGLIWGYLIWTFFADSPDPSWSPPYVGSAAVVCSIVEPPVEPIPATDQCAMTPDR
ncbi:hypothetical protein ACWCPQ_15260 [Nocardia sp. NPDC001965]